MTELQDRARQQLLARIPKGLFKCGIHPLEVAVEADDAEQVRRDIEDLLELALGQAALRHVPADAVYDVLVEVGACAPLEPSHGAVGADVPGLESDQLVSVDDLREGVTCGLEIVRMNEVEDGSAEQLLHGISKRLNQSWICASVVAVEPDCCEGVRRVLEQVLSLLLGPEAVGQYFVVLALRPGAPQHSVHRQLNLPGSGPQFRSLARRVAIVQAAWGATSGRPLGFRHDVKPTR